jgi:ABC-type multidrug transport system permease subunit
MTPHDRRESFSRDLWDAIRLAIIGWFLYVFAVPITLGRWLGRWVWRAVEATIDLGLLIYSRVKKRLFK